MNRANKFTNQIVLRPAIDSDGFAISNVIAHCFLQYQGCLFDAYENADVLAPASTYQTSKGVYWVGQDPRGNVVAGAGIKQASPESIAPAKAKWELSRFYVRPDLQGQKIGKRLLRKLENFASQNGGGDLVAWSDTRFTSAHHFYQNHGMKKLAFERKLCDLSDSQEFAFYKQLSVRTLTDKKRQSSN